MIKIRLKKTAGTQVYLSIAQNPTQGTWGSHQLLLEELKRLDEEWIEGNIGMPSGKFKQLQFNTQFLEYILKKYGELHCEFCGKPDLKIIPWNGKRTKDVATTDHFYAKKENKHLAFNRENLLVACDHCNTHKGTKEVDIETIKYYYPEKKLWKYMHQSLWIPRK